MGIHKLVKASLAASAIATSALAFASPAYAWNDRGHRLIAELAYARLDDGPRLALDALFAGEPKAIYSECPLANLSDAAVWMDCDRVRREEPQLTALHYDNIPLCGGAQREVYCPDGRCATGEIERARAVVADAGATREMRVRALAELAHIVGDIHQPFHMIDNADRGGNLVRVIYLGENAYLHPDGSKRPWTLHIIWDAPLLENALRSDVGAGSGLAEAIDDLPHENSLDPAAWGAQTHAIAASYGYGHLPIEIMCRRAPMAAVPIQPRYVAGSAPVVRKQIARAAQRLAALLNVTLR